jgi:glycogen debranching enzyme
MESPVFENIRSGDWLLDYIPNRLVQAPRLSAAADLVCELFDRVRRLHRSLVPKFCDRVIRSLYCSARKKAVSLMSPFIKSGDNFIQSLALASVAFVGPPGLNATVRCSVAAGLPDRCAGYNRHVGRSTFISLRGLLLVTGRFSDARTHILTYASLVKNGLVPSRLGDSVWPEYNGGNDSLWFLQCVQDYVEMTGENLLRVRVTDAMRLSDVVQQIMDGHANGLQQGNVRVITNWSNGFLLGDGASVESVGLLVSALRFLAASHERGTYASRGVEVGQMGFVSWKEWLNLVVTNFESWFFIPTRPDQDQQYFIEQSLVGTRGIYKDAVGAASEAVEYLFRPNLLVAMTVAAELFDPFHAVACLDMVEQKLLGHIGMKEGEEPDARESVWLTGFFFRASMRFRRKITDRMLATLAALRKVFKRSPAFGLPQFAGGRDTDACAVASILDMMYDYSRYPEDDSVDWGAEEDFYD